MLLGSARKKVPTYEIVKGTPDLYSFVSFFFFFLWAKNKAGKIAMEGDFGGSFRMSAYHSSNSLCHVLKAFRPVKYQVELSD